MQPPVQFSQTLHLEPRFLNPNQNTFIFQRGTYLAWGVAQRTCGPCGPVWGVSYLWGAPFSAPHSDAAVWSSLHTNQHVENSVGVAPQNDK